VNKLSFVSAFLGYLLQTLLSTRHCIGNALSHRDIAAFRTLDGYPIKDVRICIQGGSMCLVQSDLNSGPLVTINVSVTMVVDKMYRLDHYDLEKRRFTMFVRKILMYRARVLFSQCVAVTAGGDMMHQMNEYLDLNFQ